MESDPNEAENWQRLIRGWEDSLRKYAAKDIQSEIEQTPKLVAQFSQLTDGTAFHTQDMGWRIAVDVLFKEIESRQIARVGRNADETNLHARYDALMTRQLAYPFLAAWRLSIEIALKQTLVEVYAALEEPLPSAVRHAQRGHDVPYLWSRLIGTIARLEQVLNTQLSTVGMTDSSPGADLTSNLHNPTVELIRHVDPDGQNLRYRHSLSGETNMKDVITIDLANGHKQLGRLYSYLQHVAGIATTVQQLKECRALYDEKYGGRS